MMRLLVLLVLVIAPAIAVADDAAAQHDLLVEYTRLARGAAVGGDCVATRELAERVRALDPAFYANEFATDATIAGCLPPPTSPAAIAPVDAPVPLEPPPRPPSTVAPGTTETPRVPLPLDRPAIPPISGGYIVGEILLGGLASLLGMALGGLAGAAVCSDDGGGDGLDCLGSVILGAYFGGAAAFGVGVYGAGNSGDQTGSVGAAVLGGLAGAALGTLVLFALEDEGGNETLIGVALIGGPVIGALFGFNTTRRWKPAKPTVGSLLRFDGGKVSLGIPFVVHAEQRGVSTTTIPLLSGAF